MEMCQVVVQTEPRRRLSKRGNGPKLSIYSLQALPVRNPISAEIGQCDRHFYVLQSAAPVADKCTPKAPAECKFCTVCKRSATSVCASVKHNVIDLALDGLSGTMHLQILLLTCKTHWTAALSKRREVQADLDAAQKALHELSQQLTAIRRANKAAISELQRSINESSAVVPSKDDSDGLMKLLETFGARSEEADVAMKTASGLSSACHSTRSSLLSAEIKSADGTASSLLQSTPLRFAAEATGSPLATYLSVLSYLALCIRHPGEMEALSSTATVAPDPEVATVNKTPRKEAKAVKPLKGDGEGKKPADDSGKIKKPPGGVANEPRPLAKNPTAKKLPKEPKESVTKEGATKKGPAPSVAVPSILPAFTTIPGHLMKRKCFLALSVNGKFYGKLVIDLRPDVAPIMCAKFVQYCTNKQAPSYVGSAIFGAKPKENILGGRLAGQEDLYMADRSPLKRCRGSILLRLKKDVSKTHCFIVSSEFFIFLDDQADTNRESTVFGSVGEGLAVCDAISHLDFAKDHVAISDAGAIH